MEFTTGLLIGLTVGSCFGLVIAALCASGGRADLEHEIAMLRRGKP